MSPIGRSRFGFTVIPTIWCITHGLCLAAEPHSIRDWLLGKWLHTDTNSGQTVSVEFLDGGRCTLTQPDDLVLEGRWVQKNSNVVHVAANEDGDMPVRFDCWTEKDGFLVKGTQPATFVRSDSKAGVSATAIHGRIECGKHVAEIARLLGLYACGHDARYPPAFAALSNYVVDVKCFRCPGSGGSPGRTDRVDAWSDYILVTNIPSVADPPQAAIVYCNPANHRNAGGTVVAYTSCEILWIPSGEFPNIGCDVAHLSRESTGTSTASGSVFSCTSAYVVSNRFDFFSIGAMRDRCVSNLAVIGRAKDEAALERLWTNGTQIADSDSCVNGYVSQSPGVTNAVCCPMNGTYKYNAIGSPPTCSVPGHVLREEQ